MTANGGSFVRVHPVLGEGGLDWLGQFPGYEAVAVWADHTVQFSTGFTGHLFGIEGSDAPQ